MKESEVKKMDNMIKQGSEDSKDPFKADIIFEKLYRDVSELCIRTSGMLLITKTKPTMFVEIYNQIIEDGNDTEGRSKKIFEECYKQAFTTVLRSSIQIRSMLD